MSKTQIRVVEYLPMCFTIILLNVSSGCNIAQSFNCEQFSSAETECESLRLTGSCIDDLLPLLGLLLPTNEITLNEIPAELQFALQDRPKFDVTNNPLQDVVLGTLIGDFTSLHGCWARVENEPLSDESGEWTEAEFMIIDLDGGFIHSVRMTAVDGHPCQEDSRPFIQIFDSMIIDVFDDRLILEGIGDFSAQTTGAVNPDGSLSFHLLARFGWELSVGPEFEKIFTVDNDFLATSENRGENPLEKSDLWFRTDCAEVGDN